MAGKAALSEPLVHGTQGSSLDEERRAAQAVSPLIVRVDDSILWVVTRIFAAPGDRRVKRGGCVFLAHLLRFATLVQLSLFPATEVGDVARIAIPNILKFCRNKANGWPWCYDATLKYLGLLVAAGVLVTRPDEPGIYYLPLDIYALLPEYAGRRIEQLAAKRAKVSRSAAFKRTAIHCRLPGEQTLSPNPAWIADSPMDALLDGREMQQLVQALDAVIQNCQGVSLLPATLAEVTLLLARKLPHLMKKGSPFLARPQGQAVQLIEAAGSGRKHSQDQIADSQQVESPRSAGNLSAESAISGGSAGKSSSFPHQNLLSRAAPGQESTKYEANLPVAGKLVDSPPEAFSDITSFTLKDLLSERSDITESMTRNESTISPSLAQMADSRGDVADSGGEMADSGGNDETAEMAEPFEHPLAQLFSHETLLSWRFPEQMQQLEPGETVQSHLAGLLSQRYDDNEQRVRHYMKLLGRDCRALDIAIIDGLVRSHFPDPGHRKATLKGGWVTKRYQAYHVGEQVPQDILAWANTPYTYDAIDAILAEVASWQETTGELRRRVRPEEVIVDSVLLEGSVFWAEDAGQELRRAGLAGVDLDGEFFRCHEYEQRRVQLLAVVLEREKGVLPAEVEAELAAYLDWIGPQVCDKQEEVELLENLPEPLLLYLGKLETILDPERYLLRVQLAPLSRRRVIIVQARSDPEQTWHLRYSSQVREFVKWYRQCEQASAQEEEVVGGEIFAGDMVACHSQEEPAGQEHVSLRKETHSIQRELQHELM